MKFLLAVVLVVGSFLPAYAHESKQSGTTIVFLHVNPNDQAITNKKGTFYILITRNRYQFPIEECACSVTVLDTNNKELSTTPFTGTLGNAYVPYLLSKPGVYHVRIEGTPKTEGVFDPFSLTFDIRVERGSYLELLRDRRYLYGALGIILLLSIAFVYTKNRLQAKN